MTLRAPEDAASAAPSPRDTAGEKAPASLAAGPSSGPHPETPPAPAPELPGIGEWVGKRTLDRRPPQMVLAELRKARDYFAGLLGKGEQTRHSDGRNSNNLMSPILQSENARTPGLHAVACDHEDKMADALRELSKTSDRQEGHVRFQVGILDDAHRIAVDAFKHKEGGFTLVAVDSSNPPITTTTLGILEMRNSGLIRGILVIPTPNQAHSEGCRIFALHTLNALHDHQPQVLGLHRQLYDRAQGMPSSRFPAPVWQRNIGNTHYLANDKDAFGVLPGKFFKHMQVLKAKEGTTRTLLDEAEDRNPALKEQPLNKKEQTLRQRFASQNPALAPEEFSRADRTASVDRKRLVLLDRAIAHYEGLALESRPGPMESAWQAGPERPAPGKMPRNP
jgi:hypothetical protein